MWYGVSMTSTQTTHRITEAVRVRRRLVERDFVDVETTESMCSCGVTGMSRQAAEQHIASTARTVAGPEAAGHQADCPQWIAVYHVPDCGHCSPAQAAEHRSKAQAEAMTAAAAIGRPPAGPDDLDEYLSHDADWERSA